jgi:aminopeptidase N
MHMRTRLVSAIALALAGLPIAGMSFTGTATPIASSERTTTQLPRSVRPLHYAVAVVPHAKLLSFEGKARIDIEVLQPTRSITLNALDMTFSSASLSAAQGKLAFAAPKVMVNTGDQTATFTFAQPIPAGRYTLSLAYTGKIGTQATGLFAIDYDTRAGKKRALYTQFENSDARRFVPSWDEPAYKATFDLEATVPAGEMAVSNMPVASTTDAGHGLTRVRFQTSPKMSTYLLFFGLGDFDRATTTAEGTEIGVITQKGKTGQAQFALDSAKAVLHEYNDYFGVPYPLPKLDNIASPGSSQFFSAMENWGAIYTFEYALLLDPSISTQSDKQEVFNTAAHEMAHQWFGDLVTMRWWDDLWLNEGFASWMAQRTTEKLHPEWNTALYTVFSREGAMSRDAVATTHPVVQHVETVEQASQAFDAITYAKGEAVITMLEAYLGHDAWRDGVRKYIKAHAYGNTASDDLWHAMESVASDKPITTIAHDFTLQPGVPLIRVESASCKSGNTMLELTQGEFTKDRPNKQPLTWHVPVIAQTLGGEPARVLVAGGKASVNVPGCGPVLVNAGQSGYYRTLYKPAQFDAIEGNFARLRPIDQLGLMGDTWALGMAGLQPVSDYLDLAAAVPVDADDYIWVAVAGNLNGLDNYYKGDTRRQAALRRFAIERLAPVFKRVGWQPNASDTPTTKVLRSSLIGTLGDLGDKAVIAEADRRYAAQASNPNAMPAELRKTILAVVARHADAATWDKLHAEAKAEQTPLVKDDYYSLLSMAEDETLAKRALQLALTDEPGATNSASMIAVVAYRHPQLAFDFALAHRAQVDKLVDSTSRSRYFPGLGSTSHDPAMIGKIEAYAQEHIAPTSRRAADTAVANIKYRLMVRKDRLPAVDAWLEQHGR